MRERTRGKIVKMAKAIAFKHGITYKGISLCKSTTFKGWHIDIMQSTTCKEKVVCSPYGFKYRVN